MVCNSEMWWQGDTSLSFWTYLSVLAQAGYIMSTKQYPSATQKESGTDLVDLLLLCSCLWAQTVPERWWLWVGVPGLNLWIVISKLWLGSLIFSFFLCAMKIIVLTSTGLWELELICVKYLAYHLAQSSNEQMIHTGTHTHTHPWELTLINSYQCLLDWTAALTNSKHLGRGGGIQVAGETQKSRSLTA